MRLLTRYIIRELIPPTFLGFAFYTFIILMRTLFDLAEMIIKRSLPSSTVGNLLMLSLPHIVVLTIPMALLFGILIAVGRLSSDSEIIAMRSAGLATSAIYKPVFYFSFAIFLLNLYLINFVLPRGNSALQALKAELFTSSVDKVIKPRVFFDDYLNLVIYVNDIDQQTGQWKGVFISDTSEPNQQRMVVSQAGGIGLDRKTKQLWLDLENAEIHLYSPQKPERYDLNRNAAYNILLIDRMEDQKKPQNLTRSYREMNVLELHEAAQQARDPYDARVAWIEINKKFSIPFACLAFGIIGLPLGITNRRGGKSSGFSLSIGIILLYYIGINNGEDLARTGTIPPWLGMWLPNILLVIVGLILMRRANTDAGSSASGRTLLDRVRGAFETLKLRRKRTHEEELARATSAHEARSLASRLDIPFPNTLDRYILREFGKILGLVLISAAVLFLIVDYTELATDINENKIPGNVVVAYYRYFSLQVLNWTLPLSVLLATLVTFGIFSKNNEVTAIKSNGVSLYRTAVPVLSVACVVALLSYLLLDFVLPYSNDRMNQLRDMIKGRETARGFSVEQRQWVFGEGKYLFNFLSFDEKKKELNQLQVFEFHPRTFKLTRRVFAETATWDGNGWVFRKGWIRSFSDDGTSSYSPFGHPIKLQYREPPDYFAGEAKSPNQMSYSELRRYIKDLEKSGYQSDELLVHLYEKTSWPFIPLVMALIALPFAFRIGKRGALYGVGIALFLAFGYWALFGVFTKFGEVGNLPAILSAWSANILFALAAVYMFVHVET